MSFPQEIAVGAEGVVEIRFDATQKFGRQSVRALFFPEASDQPGLVVDLRATVRSFWVQPGQVSFGDVTDRRPVSRPLSVMAAGMPGARIVSISADVPWLRVSASKSINESDEAVDGEIGVLGRYDVTLLPDAAPLGVLEGTITIAVGADTAPDSESVQILEVPVSGNLPGDIRATPASIVFGTIRRHEQVGRVCLVRFTKPVEPSKLNVNADHPHVQVRTVVRNDVEMDLEITGTFPDSQSAGLLHGRVIGTDETGAQVFVIPYTGILAERG